MTLPDVAWNELLLVCRHQGEISVWVGWKRALAAFADPRLWEGPEHWGDYFKRQPEGTGWGMGGYGLVVMDVDTRTAWSINDYSVPGSIHLPTRAETLAEDETGARAAMAQLLGRPEAWPDVYFNTLQVRRLGGSSVTEKLPLSDFVSSERSAADNQAALVQDRGEITIKGQRRMVLKGTYAPAGWVFNTTLGRTDLDVLEQFLTHARATAFPPPDPALILPMVQSQAQVEFDGGEAETVCVRFGALLEGWCAPAAANCSKNLAAP